MTDRDQELVRGLESVKDAEEMIRNVEVKWPDLVQPIRLRIMEIKLEGYVAKHGPVDEVGQAVLDVIHAYEQAKARDLGHKFTSPRIWPSVRTKGLVRFAEETVLKSQETTGFALLKKLGLEAYTFEAVVRRYRDSFSPQAYEKAEKRLAESAAS